MNHFGVKNDQRGGLIIEVLLSIVFVMMFSAALVSLSRANAQVTTSSRLKTQAVALARESMEQVYAMKKDHWSMVNQPDGQYRVVVASGAYSLVAEPSGESIDGTFTRVVRLVTGKREVNGRLSAVGTVSDANVKLVSVDVLWLDRDQPQHVTLSGYLTNWREATL